MYEYSPFECLPIYAYLCLVVASCLLFMLTLNKTRVNSVILVLKLNLNSLRNIYIKMYVMLNEDHFICICFSMKSNSIWGWGSRYLHEFSLSNNYTVFVENHNLWRFDCTQWLNVCPTGPVGEVPNLGQCLNLQRIAVLYAYCVSLKRPYFDKIHHFCPFNSLVLDINIKTLKFVPTGNLFICKPNLALIKLLSRIGR